MVPSNSPSNLVMLEEWCQLPAEANAVDVAIVIIIRGTVEGLVCEHDDPGYLVPVSRSSL